MKHAVFHLLMRCYRALFARRCFYAFNKFLFNISLRGIGILNDEGGNLTYTGERQLLCRLTRRWPTAPTIFDIGANRGEYARMIMQYAPQASLYAFEPHPKAFGALTGEAERYGFIAFNMGCGDRQSTVSIYDYTEQDGSPHASIYKEVIESLHRGMAAATLVDVIVLDDFIREHNITKVHLLKIDAEGHEVKILEGLRSSIALNKIDIIQFEFNAMNVFSRSFFRDFCMLLPGYQFHRLLPDGPVPLDDYSPIFWELFAFQNIVAVRPNCGVHF